MSKFSALLTECRASWTTANWCVKYNKRSDGGPNLAQAFSFLHERDATMSKTGARPLGLCALAYTSACTEICFWMQAHRQKQEAWFCSIKRRRSGAERDRLTARTLSAAICQKNFDQNYYRSMRIYLKRVAMWVYERGMCKRGQSTAPSPKRPIYILFSFPRSFAR